MVTELVDQKTASAWTKKLVDLLLPTVCAACGKLGPMICSGCLQKFTKIDESICTRCGRPLTKTSAGCAKCQDGSFNLQQARSCFTYSEPLATVIHRYKYDGLFALARPLGRQMVRNWPDWESDPEVIVPIPLHARRKRSRGFNQADLLALQLGSRLNIEVDSRSLTRVRYTRPQVNLNPLERKENVWEAFAAEAGSLLGARILLVDDVFTTGATMTSAANALLEAGARSVSAYCLARTVQ